MVWIFIAYFILAAALVFLSDKLGNYIDLLDKKTKISGAFLGGVLLAAVTSLPELFTSISATLLVKQNDLVVGNILGSNLFNLLVLGACLILFCKTFIKSKIEYQSHNFTFLGLAIIYALICYGLFAPSNLQITFGPINLISIIVLIVYGLIIFLQPKESENVEENKSDTSPLSVKQISFRFTLCAILLVIISIVITYVTDMLGEELGLSSTVAGALFLAIATSLPELVSCVSLCKRNNFNAAFGDILGSCLFNFCIIGISEFLSFSQTIITQGNLDANYMAILAIISILAVFILLLLKKKIFERKLEEKNELTYKIITIIFGFICFSGYIIFLII